MTRARKIAYGLLAAGLFWIFFEGAMRGLGMAKCGPIEPDAGSWEEMVGDRNTLWKMRPNYEIPSPHGPPTRINAVGLRDTLLPQSAGGPSKSAEERRILTTGDSSVYGWGVPTGMTFQEELERLLEQRWPGHRFEVINLGVPGYSTEQSLRQLEEIGWSYDPDLLVVSNVFSDSNFDHFQDREALALANPNPSGLQASLQGSRAYCAVYMGFQRRAASRGQQPNRVLMPGVPRDARWVSDPARFGVDARVPIEDFQANIGAMIERAEKQGAKVVLAPLAQEWDAGRWSAVGLPQPAPGEALPWTPYREALVGLARQYGVIHVPFYEHFSRSQMPAARLFSDPIHPTPDGAKIMARALFSAIESSPELLGLEGGE